MGKNYDIFISYRRSDTEQNARTINAEFKSRHYRCFLDYDELKDGQFDARIKEAIKDAPLFIALLSPDYFSRCNDENDWVRQEIECALDNDKKIIPININNAFKTFPADLPQRIKDGIGCHQFSEVYMRGTLQDNIEAIIRDRINVEVSEINTNPTDQAIIKIKTDADCILTEGGETMASLQAGEYNKIHLSQVGIYDFRFTSKENPSCFVEMEYELKQIPYRGLIKVDFNTLIEEQKNKEVECKAREEQERQERERIGVATQRPPADNGCKQKSNSPAPSPSPQIHSLSQNSDPKFRKILLGIIAIVIGVSVFVFQRLSKPTFEKTETTSETAVEMPEVEYSTFTINGVAFKMVRVQGGTFQMGATSEQGSDAYDDETPVHSVTLSDYYIGQTQVTQELWQAVMGSNPSYFTGDNQRPVEKVSWDDCQEFIEKLNRLTGKNFRLPTEAEWEYAARGGNKSRGYKYSGSNNPDAVAWYDDNSGSKTHPVAQKQSNESGLYDMSGNIWEWCSERYGDYSSNSQTNPRGASTGSYRVLRGGSWNSFARNVRVSVRNFGTPDLRSHYCGLRLAL